MGRLGDYTLQRMVSKNLISEETIQRTTREGEGYEHEGINSDPAPVFLYEESRCRQIGCNSNLLKIHYFNELVVSNEHLLNSDEALSIITKL